MYKIVATRGRDETTDDTKRQRVEEPINLALQGIVNSLGDYGLRGKVNKAAVGLTAWINKEDGSPQASKIEASKRILKCYKAHLEGQTDETATYLELEYLALTTLPAEIGNLTNLKYLYLNDNQLTSVEEVGKLTNLTVLFLANNQLTSIEGVNKLTNLTRLSLYNNYLPQTESGKLPEHMRDLGVGPQKGVEEFKEDYKK